VARLANEKISWLDQDDRRRLLDIADRLRRWLDDLDAGVARTAVLADEINNLMAEATNRRAYQMSVMALLFLPASFLTGLFGINLGGIPGAESDRLLGLLRLPAGAGDRAGGLAQASALVVGRHDDMGILWRDPAAVAGAHPDPRPHSQEPDGAGQSGR
jgi:hypothetical protein